MNPSPNNSAVARAPVLSALRATRAFVDLDAIAGNIRAMKASLPPTCRMMAVVKADGYGHGAPWVAATALTAGVDSLGVATVGEARRLRERGIEGPVVILGAISPGEVPVACGLGIELTIAEETLLEAVQRHAREHSTRSQIAVHLKIDTGLRRYGALPAIALALAHRIERDPCLRFAGIFTHFASSDEPGEPFTSDQTRRFLRVLDELRSGGVGIPTTHAANSAGVLTDQGCELDLVRPGIAVYGIPPSAEVALLPGMRPAMRVESRVARLTWLEVGDTVGYNRTFRADTRIPAALVPIGYADGYRRSLSNVGWVGIKGRRARVLGRVSMDQIVVEIPRGADVQVGELVEVLGGDAESGSPSAQEIAELTGTNAYEVLVGIRQRVPRVFVRDGEVVNVSDGDGAQ